VSHAVCPQEGGLAKLLRTAQSVCKIGEFFNENDPEEKWKAQSWALSSSSSRCASDRYLTIGSS
jgi:hypothetical protein